MHHAEAQTGGATIIRAMYFARVDYYDVIGSDMLRFAVVIKLHNQSVQRQIPRANEVQWNIWGCALHEAH
jgi:hypothetical protein